MEWIQAQAARIAIYAMLLLFYSILVWFHGYTKGEKKFFDYRDKQATESVKLVVKQGAATQTTVTKYIRVLEQSVPIERIIEKKVFVYADTPHAAVLDSAHCLSPDWRRLHDAAATRTVPDTASGTDATSEAPTAAASIQTVTTNYAAHHACVDELDSLQEWVRAQQAVNPSSP